MQDIFSIFFLFWNFLDVFRAFGGLVSGKSPFSAEFFTFPGRFPFQFFGESLGNKFRNPLRILIGINRNHYQVSGVNQTESGTLCFPKGVHTDFHRGVPCICDSSPKDQSVPGKSTFFELQPVDRGSGHIASCMTAGSDCCHNINPGEKSSSKQPS